MRRAPVARPPHLQLCLKSREMTSYQSGKISVRTETVSHILVPPDILTIICSCVL